MLEEKNTKIWLSILDMIKEYNYPGMGGGGGIPQIFRTWVQHMKKTWTQSDLRFCENEGFKKI